MQRRGSGTRKEKGEHTMLTQPGNGRVSPTWRVETRSGKNNNKSTRFHPAEGQDTHGITHNSHTARNYKRSISAVRQPGRLVLFCFLVFFPANERTQRRQRIGIFAAVFCFATSLGGGKRVERVAESFVSLPDLRRARRVTRKPPAGGNSV